MIKQAVGLALYIRGVEEMNRSTVQILNKNPDALGIAASAARMSTQSGTAFEIYDRSGDREKDLKLISKVLSSGHKSVIEHQTVSIAFNDVSVMVEQFIIEFRLASFTVKSRRYVDFSSAGYVVPEGLSGETLALYQNQMDALFASYVKLMDLGVPKEDARFVFPYSLRSNFFMTINARELIHMICTMLYGRGARWTEIRNLGCQLKEQFDEIYPGVIDAESVAYRHVLSEKLPETFRTGTPQTGDAEVIGVQNNAKALLQAAMRFSGRFESDDFSANMKQLLNDTRPRELEMLNYTFHIQNISLACITHFTRHRIQSPLIPSVYRALCEGNYVLPESISSCAEALEIYQKAFAEQAEVVRKMKSLGVCEDVLIYFAMSGHVMDILMSMNAREILLLSKLRTCSRAQWEIRGVARKMLLRLNVIEPDIFNGYGPSCAVTGKCPEGKMTCGKPIHIENGVWKTRD